MQPEELSSRFAEQRKLCRERQVSDHDTGGLRVTGLHCTKQTRSVRSFVRSVSPRHLTSCCGWAWLLDGHGARRPRRREFLGAWLFRKHGRDSAAAGMVVGNNLLSRGRLGERKRRSVEGNNDQAIQSCNQRINANVHGQGDIGFFGPTYVFATPVLGGQFSASLLGVYGREDAALNATIGGSLAGLPLPTRSISIEQSAIAFGDVIPQFTLRWNAGVNNYMTYITGDIPVGKYNSSDLANLGLGHGAIDGGVAYTYFDQAATNFPPCSA